MDKELIEKSHWISYLEHGLVKLINDSSEGLFYFKTISGTLI